MVDSWSPASISALLALDDAALDHLQQRVLEWWGRYMRRKQRTISALVLGSSDSGTASGSGSDSPQAGDGDTARSGARGERGGTADAGAGKAATAAAGAERTWLRAWRI